jgi:hypothetical protein
LAGDLTLQVLLDAALSGYIKNLDIEPFERRSLLKLHMALQWYYQSKSRLRIENELQAGLAAQICMAIGNRKAYKEAADSAYRILDKYEQLLFIGSKQTESGDVDTSWQGGLARFWEEHYGMSLAEANQKGL